MNSNHAPATAIKQAAATAPKPSRMVIGSVVKGRLQKPPRVLLYGVEKIGKSTFAAASESPIFLCAEDGTSELDVERFPEPRTWAEVLEALDALAADPHGYKTLVIDTLDWLEPLCWAFVCAKGHKSSIEDFGYGKGYNAAVDEWRVLLARLDRLRSARGMGIVLLAHSWIKQFKNPTGDDYDRHELKVHAKSGGLIKEWCDAVLFATYETYTHSKDGRTKGVSTGARIVHSQRMAAWDAGNRYDLPESIPLDWATFAEHVKSHRPADPAVFRARIEALLASVDEKMADKVRASVTAAGDDSAELARITDKLSAKVQTKEAE